MEKVPHTPAGPRTQKEAGGHCSNHFGGTVKGGEQESCPGTSQPGLHIPQQQGLLRGRKVSFCGEAKGADTLDHTSLSFVPSPFLACITVYQRTTGNFQPQPKLSKSDLALSHQSSASGNPVSPLSHLLILMSQLTFITRAFIN